MKFTPYIFIVIFFFSIHISFAQKEKRLLIVGADSNSSTLINQISYPEYVVDSTLVQTLNGFTSKLEKLGFINYQIDSTYVNDSISYHRISIHKSLQSITMVIPDPQLFVALSHYKIVSNQRIQLNFAQLHSFMDEVVEFYSNDGHVFVKASIENIIKKEHTLLCTLVIAKQQKRYLNRIIIQGYDKFPKSFVKHYLGLRKGDVLSPTHIMAISTKIKEISFTSEIRKPELLFTKDSTALYLYLKKEKSNYFDGLIGFSNAKEKGVQLNGYLNLGIQNAFDKGESLRLKWLADGNQSQSLAVGLQYPYLYSTPISFTYDFNLYKKDSSFVNIKHQVNLDYQLSTRYKMGFHLEQSVSNAIVEQLNNVDFDSYFYGIYYEHVKPTKHPIHPHKWKLRSSFSKGKRSSENQTKITNELFYLKHINHRQFITLENKTAVLLSENYIENELYRLGGASSIRGFDERSLSTLGYSYTNIAYAYLVGSDVYLSGMGDYGLLKQTHSDRLLQVYSFGIGYHFTSKIGQVGLAYFVGNTSENSFSFGSSKLHIQLIQKF